MVRPLTDFTFRDARRINREGRCDLCRFPSCDLCGQKSSTAVPIANKQPKENGSKECGQWYCDFKTCKALRPRTCDVCLQDKDVQMFKKYGTCRNLHSSCLACEFPTCRICGHAHPESESPIEKNSRSRLGSHWYCPEASCQERLQQDSNTCQERQRRCDVCLQHKDKQLFAKYKDGKYHTSCSACAYPTCRICGHEHPQSEKPINKRSRNRLGTHWYCSAPSCQEN